MTPGSLVLLLVSLAYGGPTLDLNRATAEQLAMLPGLGPAKAAAVVAWRQTNGPFASVDGLLRVPHIGPGTVENLRGRVSVDDADPTDGHGERTDRVDINTAGADLLCTLPGITPAIAARIVAARPHRSCDDLSRLQGVGPATVANLGERCVASVPGDG